MASLLKVDALTGVTTAGSISVTGEGNSTTTNLQQSLTKCWFLINGGGTPAYRDSFNCSSLDDYGTGDYGVNFTNNMGNANYSVTGAIGNGNDGDVATSNFRRGSTYTTGLRATANYAASGSNAVYDYAYIGGSVNGDLA